MVGMDFTQNKPNEMLLHLGPQHPIQPGPFLLDLKLTGETVIEANLDMGYIHKGIEKIMESLTWTQCMPITDRICYLAASTNNEVYCSGVEKLCGIEVPERSQYIRVIVHELSRIQSHLLGIGEYATDLGFLTMFLYMIREREEVLTLIEDIAGQRVTLNFIRFGGVRQDLPEGFAEKTNKTLTQLRKKIDEHDEIMSSDGIYRDRTIGVGVLTPEIAKSLGVAGPPLRATGVAYDVRKDEPYLVYDDLDFKVVTGTDGDIYTRIKVRLEEIRQSIYIIEQAFDQIPQGPLFTPGTPYGRRTPVMRVPEGEVWSRVEDPRGEMAMYLVSDGSKKPYRVKIRGPVFATMQTLPPLLKGVYMADVSAIAASMDACTSEADR